MPGWYVRKRAIVILPLFVVENFDLQAAYRNYLNADLHRGPGVYPGSLLMFIPAFLLPRPRLFTLWPPMRQNRHIASVCIVFYHIASGYAQPVGKDLSAERSRFLVISTSLDGGAVPTISSLPVETTSKASSSHSGVIPTKTSSPLVASPHSSIHSTRTPTHVLSSPASTFNSVAAATGSVSLSSRTSKVAYLSIGGAIAGFFLILIVAFIVSLSRRRKRRHSFVIPGIRHPFRPTNTARLDEDPFSGLGYSDWPYSRAPPTNSRYSISTIPLSATSMSSPNSSTADNKKSFSQCSPPPLEDEESNTPESPPMIQITFDWERSQWPGYLNNRRPHDRTTWRWSTASQTFSSIFPMAILRP